MAQAAQIRGMMEQSIDVAIDEAKALLDTFRDPAIKRGLMLREENDFIMGMAWGMAFKTFQGMAVISLRRVPTEQEFTELTGILIRRMPQLREALFRAG